MQEARSQKPLSGAGGLNEPEQVGDRGGTYY
jgi:hypothetical protein